MAMLRSNHPPVSVDPRIVQFPDQCSPLCATQSFVRSSNGGVDGIHPGHIRDLVSMDANKSDYRLLNSLSRLANHIFNGNLSYLSRDALLASSLTALRKKDRGIRPIAVGNMFRRIASKLAVRSVRTRVSEQLRTVQVGFDLADEAEATVHAARKFITNDRPHDILLKIDMRNAFNSLRSDHIIEKTITT